MGDLEEQGKSKYRKVLENFLDSYLTERDVAKTLSLVTEDVFSLGTGEQEVAHNKAELQVLLETEMKSLNMPITYVLDNYYEKEVAPDTFLCMCDVTACIEMEGQSAIQYPTRLTAGFRKEEDMFRAYHLHMSESSVKLQAHEFFPLHYASVEVSELDGEDLVGLIELMKKTLPGGAMGGYVEPGFPLYFINDELLNWLGYTYDEFIAENGQMMIRTMHPDDGHMVEEKIAKAFEQGNEYSVEYRMRRKDGNYIWVRDTGRKTVTSSGRTAMISVITDISSDRKKQQCFERTIASMKKERRRYDRMTGLLTRGPAEILIEQSLSQDEKGALLLMDIDNFKLVNDVMGHPVGDQVLIKFAEHLRTVLPSEATLARLGGDEFIAFIPSYKDLKQLSIFADHVLLCTDNLIDEPVLSNKLGVSIGIALTPGDGEDFNTLYTNADKAQYYAKRNGKGRCSFFEQIPILPISGGRMADINLLCRMVQSIRLDKGAFLVEFDAFHKVVQFIQRNITRMRQSMQIQLYTIQAGDHHSDQDNGASADRSVLKNAIQYQLRRGDLVMDFSENQIAVLLVDCNQEKAGQVALRIIDSYMQMASEDASRVTYESCSIDEEDRQVVK